MRNGTNRITKNAMISLVFNFILLPLSFLSMTDTGLHSKWQSYHLSIAYGKMLFI